MRETSLRKTWVVQNHRTKMSFNRNENTGLWTLDSAFIEVLLFSLFLELTSRHRFFSHKLYICSKYVLYVCIYVYIFLYLAKDSWVSILLWEHSEKYKDLQFHLCILKHMSSPLNFAVFLYSLEIVGMYN